MSSEIETNIDGIISKAVEAKIEAAVMASLSGDEVMGKYVEAALSQEVEINGKDYWRKQKVTFMHKVITEAVQKRAKEAVDEFLQQETAMLKDLVRKQLKRKANVVAEQLVDSLSEKSLNAYGVTVDMTIKTN